MNAPATFPLPTAADTCAYTAPQVEAIKASAERYRDRVLAKPAGDYVARDSRKRAAAYQQDIINACTGVLDHIAGHEGFEDCEWELRDLLEGDNSRPAQTYSLMGNLA